MLELGQKSKFYHLEVAKILNNAEIDEIYLVGKEVVHIHNQLKKLKHVSFLKILCILKAYS